MIVSVTTTVEVPGEAVAKGRPRFVRVGKAVRTYTPKRTASFENLVRLAFQQALRAQAEALRAEGKAMLAWPADGPVELAVGFVRVPPKGESKKRREAMLAGAPCAKRPDLDNLLKGVKDALNGVAWFDDGQVHRIVAQKQYGPAAKTVLTVTRYLEVPDAVESRGATAL